MNDCIPLELVKVGDCVEAPKFMNNKIVFYGVCEVEKYKYDGKNCVAIQDEFGNTLNDYIVAVWKRTDNTMARHEICENARYGKK